MAEDKYLDKAGLAFYDAIQKGRLESVATLENQEIIISKFDNIDISDTEERIVGMFSSVGTLSNQKSLLSQVAQINEKIDLLDKDDSEKDEVIRQKNEQLQQIEERLEVLV